MDDKNLYNLVNKNDSFVRRKFYLIILCIEQNLLLFS